MASIFTNLFGSIFNYETANHDGVTGIITDPRKGYSSPPSKPTVSKMEQMKNVLGKLKRDVHLKEKRLGLALGAPVLVMSGGAEKLEFVGGQYGGGASADAYTAPDDASQVVFSTARVLANILKSNETELKSVVPDDTLRQVRDDLKELHKQERNLFGAVYALGEAVELGEDAPKVELDMHLDDGRKVYMENLQKAREAHKDATETRAYIINTVMGF